jgi:hypothetical protein
MVSSLSVSWQRIYNTGTITVSLNYTLQVLHINSSLHSRTPATNAFLHSLPYRTELSTELSWTDPSVILEPLIIRRHGPCTKITAVYCCVAQNTWKTQLCTVACWYVFTEPLPRNGLHNPVVLLLHACIT